MLDIGAQLRETRMRRRIDMTEVEAATKIRAKYLRALENEEWDLLPGPTFVRSFLRTYAEALGLDAKLLEEILRDGAAASFMLDDRGARMVHGTDEVKSALDIFVKDMGLVAALAQRAHVPTPVASAAEQLYLLAEHAGLGAHDDSSVVTMLAPADGEDGRA